jgi:hypothetical protein
VETMRRQSRRLRALSLDDIDPLFDDPSLIGKPWPSSSGASGETRVQGIQRVLMESYDGYTKALDEMRKAQMDEYAEGGDLEGSLESGPGKGCQIQ